MDIVIVRAKIKPNAIMETYILGLSGPNIAKLKKKKCVFRVTC